MASTDLNNSTKQETLIEEESQVPKESIPKPQVTFPNGGWVAWLNVCGSILVCFCTLGFTQSFGVFQDYYTRIFLSGHSPSQISWIGSVQLFMQFFLAPFSGRLFDDGYFNYLLFGSSFLLVFSTFMISLAQPHHYYEVFLAQALGQGIAMGGMFLPSVSILAQYFSVRRSIVMGLAVTGSSVAGVIIPIMLNHLFNGKVGFAWGVRCLGFIALGMLIIANLIMKSRFPRRPSPSKEENRKLLKKLLTDTPYHLATLGFFLVYWGLYFPFFYLQLFGILHGINKTLAFYSIALLNISSLVGRITLNFLADRYGPMNLAGPCALISGILIFVMFGAKTVAGFLVFAILYGFFSGATLSLSLAGITMFADDVSEVGIRNGMILLVLSFALLTGNPIVGAMLHVPEYRWERPLIFCGIIISVGAVLVMISRNMLAKKRGTWKV